MIRAARSCNRTPAALLPPDPAPPLFFPPTPPRRCSSSRPRPAASHPARSGAGVVGGELFLEHVHRLEEGGPLAGGQPVEDPGERAGGAVQPLLDHAGLGRLDLDERPAAVGRVSPPVDEAGPVEVGEHAADGGEGQAEEGGELADGDGTAAQLLQRRDVPGPERCARARRDPVLPAPHAPRHAREQLHEPQAEYRVLPAARFVAHAALLDQTRSHYILFRYQNYFYVLTN